MNPLLKSTDRSLARLASNVGFRLLHVAFGFLWAFMVVATILIVLRTVVVIILALVQRRGTRLANLPPTTGDPAVNITKAVPLSVIIAAYNEEKVIAATLRSVLDTDYAGEVEVLVINDGSKDRTGETVSAVASTNPTVRLVEQANAGKSEALRRGVDLARHNLLVFLDADTLFQRDTLRHLVAPFAESRVGRGGPDTRGVGNARSFIARCQALEYICGFNLDRRAYDAWGLHHGRAGGRSARWTARRCARWAGSTRTRWPRDTDLTLSLHRHGYHVRYQSGAVAWTEAPETIRTLAKQRFRWCFGTMQCLWKHRDMLFNPRFRALGFFSLPSIWFFQILLVALTPLVDLLLLASILLGDGRGGPALLPDFPGARPTPGLAGLRDGEGTAAAQLDHDPDAVGLPAAVELGRLEVHRQCRAGCPRGMGQVGTDRGGDRALSARHEHETGRHRHDDTFMGSLYPAGWAGNRRGLL